MTKERFVEFLQENIFTKYKNNLIILDNAGSHNNDYVKDAIIKSGNKYLYSIPYNPSTNATIEQYFNQIKHYLKLNKKVLKYDELKDEVKKAIKNVKKENYQNYFNSAYNKEIYKNHIKKESTLILYKSIFYTYYNIHILNTYNYFHKLYINYLYVYHIYRY